METASPAKSNIVANNDKMGLRKITLTLTLPHPHLLSIAFKCQYHAYFKPGTVFFDLKEYYDFNYRCQQWLRGRTGEYIWQLGAVTVTHCYSLGAMSNDLPRW